MKKENSLYNFFLHYGISAVLVVMMVGLAYMLQTIGIKNKASVDVFYENNSTYVAYVSKNNQFFPRVGHCLEIDSSDKKQLFFKITAIREENLFFVLQLLPKSNEIAVKDAFSNNTKFSGYIFTNRIKLWDLVFSKWANLH